MMQYFCMCECLFVICKSIEFYGANFSMLRDDDILYLNQKSASKIKSIEHVKPTDL